MFAQVYFTDFISIIGNCKKYDKNINGNICIELTGKEILKNWYYFLSPKYQTSPLKLMNIIKIINQKGQNNL